MSYLDRLLSRKETPSGATGKTGKSQTPPRENGGGGYRQNRQKPPAHEKTEGSPTGKTGKSPLLPVLPVPLGAIPENRTPDTRPELEPGQGGDIPAAERPTPDPWPELYRRWFEGLTEPRALVTLDASQAGEAIATGAVPVELARTCVLLAYRSPCGVAGLLAIPRAAFDRDPFALIRIIEEAPCLH